MTIELPMFMTKDLNLLCSHHDGVIFKLSPDVGSVIGYPYFNTAFIADHGFGNDREALFYHSHLKLNDIIYQYRSCQSYLKSLCLFQKMTNGYYFSHMLDRISMKHQRHIITMMQEQWLSRRRPPVSEQKQSDDGNLNNNNIENEDAIPPYIQQLFQFYCTNKSSDVWFIPSELGRLSPNLSELLFEDNHFGQCLETWRRNNGGLEIKFVYELSWQFGGDSLKQFHSLSLEQWMTGSAIRCDETSMQWRVTDDSLKSTDTVDDESMDGMHGMNGMEEEVEDEQMDDWDDVEQDDDLQHMLDEEDMEPLTDYDVVEEEDSELQPNQAITSGIVFIPYCKRSTQRSHEFGEFGLYLQQLPPNVTSIRFEYEVYCPEAGYSLCVPPQKWMNVGENVAFTSFKTSKVGNAPFSYNVALKIKQIR